MKSFSGEDTFVKQVGVTGEQRQQTPEDHDESLLPEYEHLVP